MNPVVRLERVAKEFRGRPVFSQVDLELWTGECLAVQGHNGSGKSVLFKIICRLIRPDEGSVTIDPAYLDRRAVFPQGFGMIIDGPGYLAGRTGVDNLRSLAGIRGLIGDPEIVDAMERVGLDPDLEQKVGNYSMGMKQKLALAQAFMEGQQVLVLDEPFNALDDASVELVHSLLAELLQQGRTIIFASHQQSDVDRLASRRVKITDQRLVAVN